MTASPEIWTLFVGPFVGATLAFALARLYDANRRFKDQLAAANLALLTLKNQYNDFTLFRRGFFEDCARPTLDGSEPTWALLRPNFLRYGDYEFDYSAIAFLFENGGQMPVFDAVEEAQIAHRHLLKMDEQRTETAREMQRVVAKESNGKVMSLEEAATLIGIAMVSELDMLAEGLAVTAAYNGQIYVKAFDSLRLALSSHIAKSWKYRIGCHDLARRKEPVQQMLVQVKARLSQGFNADELPPLPRQLQTRVDRVIASKTAGNVSTSGGQQLVKTGNEATM